MVTTSKILFHRKLLLTSAKMIFISPKWQLGRHLTFQLVVRVLEVEQVSLHDYRKNFFSYSLVSCSTNVIFLHLFPCSEIMDEVGRKEKEAGVFPDPDIDIFMKVFLSITIPHVYFSSVTTSCHKYISVLLCFLYLNWTVNIKINYNGSCHIVDSILRCSFTKIS